MVFNIVYDLSALSRALSRAKQPTKMREKRCGRRAAINGIHRFPRRRGSWALPQCGGDSARPPHVYRRLDMHKECHSVPVLFLPLAVLACNATRTNLGPRDRERMAAPAISFAAGRCISKPARLFSSHICLRPNLLCIRNTYITCVCVCV